MLNCLTCHFCVPIVPTLNKCLKKTTTDLDLDGFFAFGVRLNSRHSSLNQEQFTESQFYKRTLSCLSSSDEANDDNNLPVSPTAIYSVERGQ